MKEKRNLQGRRVSIIRDFSQKRSNRRLAWFTVVITIALMLSVSVDVMSQVPKVADKDTLFNRVKVLGNGDNAAEDKAFEDDLNELKGDLEQSKNQKSGSNNTTFIKPTKKEVTDQLDAEKKKKQPGEELTFYFSGHGNVDLIRLTAAERMSAKELADALKGFRKSVTVVVILDSCFGGSFADDIGETDHVAVIGPSTTCPVDPPGIFGGFTETFTEAIADKAGEGEGDENGDGIVTADELKKALERQGWTLGQPQPGDKIKKGKSKCTDCDLPSIKVEPLSAQAGTQVQVNGERFAPGVPLKITVLGEDLRQSGLTPARTDAHGSFTARLFVRSVPSLIVATDQTGNEDWQLLSRTCDVDVDADIDKLDLRAISSARDTRVSAGDPRDADHNGRITANDRRLCSQRCTKPNCARLDPRVQRTPAEPR